jgi:hypothetical protein
LAAISVDHEVARTQLRLAWSLVDDASVSAPGEIEAQMRFLVNSGNVTFRYILVTGLLGKLSQSRVHPRALQTSSRLKHSYDARSLCHEVVVTFEKEHGNLWGLSNEPFVNKPARHPQHDQANRQLRDKPAAKALHEILEFAHKAPPESVLAMLVQALRYGKERAAARIEAVQEAQTTYRRVVDFANAFLADSDGGTRLAAVVGAFVRLLNSDSVVKVHPPNFSDKFAKTLGDVEILHAKKVVSAIECKHRPLNADDVRHGVRKGREGGVSEYFFVTAAGIAVLQESEISIALADGRKHIDVHHFDIAPLVEWWTAALNPVRRGRFGAVVAEILRDDMRRAEVADRAALLWNDLEQ